MLNDFIIKSSIKNLESRGFDVVNCSELFFEGDILDGCVFKIKHQSIYFYSLCFPGGDFSFDEHVLFPIEYIVEKYLVDLNLNTNLEVFIEDQCFMRLYSEYNRTLGFNTVAAINLFKALAKKYTNKLEFLEDIDNINLDNIVTRV